MSTAQIRGMEQTDFAAFHNQQFFLRGVEKYARHLALPEDSELWGLLEQVRQPLNHPKANPARQEITAMVKSGFFKHKTSVWAYFARHPVFWIMTIALTAFGINLNARIENENLRQQSLANNVIAPTVSKHEVTLKPALSSDALPDQVTQVVNEHTQPDTPIAITTTPQQTEAMTNQVAAWIDPSPAEIQVKHISQANISKLTLQFSGPSWVQYVAKDGSITEKIYQPEDVLEVDPAILDSMVIGNAGATILKAGNVFVDLNQHSSTKNGVARLKQEDLNHLVN
jgi:cytoskeletal protein RodZ